MIAAAFAFDRVEGAEAALAHPRVVASETFNPAPDSFALVEPAPALGDEAVRLRLEDGRAVVVWRSGATVGLVLAGGRRAAVIDATILRLAAAEQARIAAPTPLRRSDNDDSAVPLDDPDLRGPVHWLGKRLPARGRSPGLALADSIRADRSEARQGFRALLLYRSRAGRSAISLVLEQPRALRQAALRRQLRRIRREACTRFERIPLSGGRASIYARAPQCGREDDQTPLAIARFPRAVAVVSLGCHPLRTTRALRNPRRPAPAGARAAAAMKPADDQRVSALRRWLAAALALLVALMTATSAAAASSPYSADLALRLPDLGPGYVVALDHGCVPLRPRGVAASSEGCQVSYKRVWTPTGMAPGPSFVTSVAFVFQSPEAAHAALARPRALAARVLGVRRDVIAIAGPTPALGDEAVLLRFDDRDTDVLWRSGSIVGLVAPSSTDGGDAGDESALRLAAAQQAHVAMPTPVTPSDYDDLEVPLDDPRLEVPVYWLGRRLAAHGSLPPLRFVGSELSRGQDARAGARAELRYEGHGASVDVGLTQPSLLRRPFVRRVLRRLHRDPCTRIARFPALNGRAAIYTRAASCKRKPADVFALVVRHDVAVVVTVDLFGRPSRYATRAGLRRLVRALRVRKTQTP